MKKLFLIIVLIAGIDIVTAVAQEFKLPVTFTGSGFARVITFGFDPNASDSMTDTQWGEAPDPGIYNPNDLEVRMTSRILGRTYLTSGSPIPDDGGYIDIRRKPVQDSFILQYEIYNTKWDQGVPGIVSMQWDNIDIPPIIKHIYMAPEEDHRVQVRLDMKTSSHFDIPDSMLLYGTMLITVLYNRETMAVSQTNDAVNELTVSPNPMDSRSTLRFNLKEDRRVNLSAHDITGKKVFERPIYGSAGENETGIDRNDFSAHPGVYLIRLSGIQNGSSFQKSTTIIVQ